MTNSLSFKMIIMHGCLIVELESRGSFSSARWLVRGRTFVACPVMLVLRIWCLNFVILPTESWLETVFLFKISMNSISSMNNSEVVSSNWWLFRKKRNSCIIDWRERVDIQRLHTIRLVFFYIIYYFAPPNSISNRCCMWIATFSPISGILTFIRAK